MYKIILVSGGSASGKTTVAKELKNKYKGEAILISQDVFYKAQGSPETNYDLPEAFDFELQNQIFNDLRNGKEVDLPVYSFADHKRIGTKKVKPTKLIIFEGLFTLHDKEFRDKADFRIFVDTPSDTRLARRVKRDVNERGRDVNAVLDRWINTVQPSFEEFISKHKRNVDIIIPWSQVKDKAIQSLVATFTDITKS